MVVFELVTLICDDFSERFDLLSDLFQGENLFGSMNLLSKSVTSANSSNEHILVFIKTKHVRRLSSIKRSSKPVAICAV